MREWLLWEKRCGWVVCGLILVFYGVLSWQVDGWLPDRYDIIGAAVALAGVVIIMWGRHL